MEGSLPIINAGFNLLILLILLETLSVALILKGEEKRNHDVKVLLKHRPYSNAKYTKAVYRLCAFFQTVYKQKTIRL